MFRRLAQVMKAPQLAEDARFVLAVDRSHHHEELDDLIGRWAGQHDLAELEHALHAAGVPATRIFTIADIFGDPHYRARGMIVQAADDELGEVAMASPVPRLSDTPGAIRHAGHRIGEDNRRVLAEVAGLSDAEIGALERAGIIACQPTTAGEGSDESIDERAGAA